MKKQILAYRQEIIELSTNKKAMLRDKINQGHVPRLDLSKVKQDSDDSSDEDGDGENPKDLT